MIAFVSLCVSIICIWLCAAFALAGFIAVLVSLFWVE